MPAGGVEGATEIVGLLRRPIVGMTEEGLSNADMRGIADRQLRRNDLPVQMRVESAAEFTFRDRADDLADFFRRKRPAAIADPQRIPGGRRRRTTHQLRPTTVLE
jgi:hypothetical protein